METIRVNLVGASPLVVSNAEDINDVKIEIVQNFKGSIVRVKENRKIDAEMSVEVDMDINMTDSGGRIDRSMGLKKYKDWKLIITMTFDESKVDKKEVVEIIEMAASGDAGP